MGRRRFLVGVALVFAAGGGVSTAWLQSRGAQQPLPASHPFADLGTALAALPGWELHRAPPHAGPYRVLPESSLLGGAGALNCRVREGGSVVEEMRLEGNAEYDQLVVRLDTPSGRRTMAVLKRPR